MDTEKKTMDRESLKIQIYRNKNAEALTKDLSDPECRADTGSAAAMTAALASSQLERASLLAETQFPENEDVIYIVRNAEILRAYMVKLIDEDVKCRGPLRRAMKEGGEREVEAGRQTAVCICQEIVAMAGKGLELLLKLRPFCEDNIRYLLISAAELYLGAVKAAVAYILHMGRYSTDDTYQYILKRENEITLSEYIKIYDEIIK